VAPIRATTAKTGIDGRDLPGRNEQSVVLHGDRLFHTGKKVFREVAGAGLLYNNDYAGSFLGSDGAFMWALMTGSSRCAKASKPPPFRAKGKLDK
jgi:hypothetical protein